MRKTVLLLLLVVLYWGSYSQTLKKGNYISPDGLYTVSIEHNGTTITLTEPNKVSTYISKGNGYYYNTEEKYLTYYLKIAGEDKFYSGKDGGQEYLFSYSAMNELLADGLDDCPVYDKYLEKAEEDPVNTQTWTFCGGAAMAKCTMNAAGVREFLRSIVIGLKSISVHTGTCPCTDAITPAEWAAYNP